MRTRFVIITAIVCIVAAVFAANCTKTETGYLTGRDVVGTLYAVGDTSTLTTWDTLVDVTGSGVLRQLNFRNLSNAKDCSVKVYINGNLLATLTEASNEERTQYVVLNPTPSAVGTDTYLAIQDSTMYNGLPLNVPFTGSMKVTYNTESGGTGIVSAIYERR